MRGFIVQVYERITSEHQANRAALISDSVNCMLRLWIAEVYGHRVSLCLVSSGSHQLAYIRQAARDGGGGGHGWGHQMRASATALTALKIAV